MMPSNIQSQFGSDHKVFQNLARSPRVRAYESKNKMDIWDDDSVAVVTAACRQELETARIKVVDWPGIVLGEVPSRVVGSLSGWLFERRWYYWTAKGPGIPVEIAEKLHETHGQEVRVDGHCGAPHPREYRKGFAIDLYHVDTQEGLNALADALRSIYDPTKDPGAKPYMGAPYADEVAK